MENNSKTIMEKLSQPIIEFKPSVGTNYNNKTPQLEVIHKEHKDMEKLFEKDSGCNNLLHKELILLAEQISQTNKILLQIYEKLRDIAGNEQMPK